MADAVDSDKPLRKISEAFKDLAAAVSSQDPEVGVSVEPFSRACSLVSPLFGCLGIAFKFAEMDYVAKVILLWFTLSHPPSSTSTFPVIAISMKQY